MRRIHSTEIAFVVGAALFLTVAGCADFSRGSSPDTGSTVADAGAQPGPVDVGAQPGPVDVTATDAGGVDTQPSADATPGSAPTFVTDVHPILLSRCKACHVQGGMAGGTRYLLTGDDQTDYDTVTQPPLVDLNDPPNSLILRKPSKQMSHGGGMVMGQNSGEFATILQWIEAGVPFE